MELRANLWLFEIMVTASTNTYSTWLQIANEVKINGLNDKNYASLETACPIDLNIEWRELLIIQVAELLRQLLKDIFHSLEKKLNDVLQYGDTSLIDRELVLFRKKLKQCLFYINYPCISVRMKQKVNLEISENVRAYQMELMRYLKNAAMDYPGHFTEEVLYLLQKRSFYNYVKEQMITLAADCEDL